MRVFSELTSNDFLGGRIQIAQPSKGYRAGSDPVLLAAAVPGKESDRILDLGCGVGTAGFCVLARQGNCKLIGVDILPEFIEIAQKNAEQNSFVDRASFEIADIRSDLSHLGLFDQILINPPYFAQGAHNPSPISSKAIARGEVYEDTDLEDWINCAYKMLKSGGGMTMINRAERLDDIIIHLGNKFGCTRILPLWPRQGEEAKRIIIYTRKDKRGSLKLLNGIVMHNDDNSPTVEANRVLRDGAAIEII